MKELHYDTIILLGDIHGDFERLNLVIEEAAEYDLPIFQLGDFGYWRHRPEGQDFFEKVIASLEENNVDLYFIRGNHELTVNDGIPKSRVPPGLLELEANVSDCFHLFENSNHLYYILDGKPWQIGPKTFMGVGGAYSIDKAYRSPYISWWPEEEVSGEILESVRGQKIDVLLSHETPEYSHPYLLLNAFPIPESVPSRIRVKEIAEETLPHVIFHGHWHQKYSTIEEYANSQKVLIAGLADNQSSLRANRVFLHVETTRYSSDYEDIKAWVQ